MPNSWARSRKGARPRGKRLPTSQSPTVSHQLLCGGGVPACIDEEHLGAQRCADLEELEDALLGDLQLRPDTRLHRARRAATSGRKTLRRR